MTHEPVRLLVISAGLSTPSSTRMLADQLSRASRLALESRGAEVTVTTVELRDIAHEVTDAMLTRFPGERLSRVIDELRAADGVILSTPIFNTAPSGLLTSFLAAVDPDLWRERPVLLAATAGTARHSLSLEYSIRPMLQYLKARIAPTAVFAASSDFGATRPGETAEDTLIGRSRRAGTELADMIMRSAAQSSAAQHSAAQHPAATPDEAAGAGDQAFPDTGPAPAALDPEFTDFVPMSHLLRP